MWAGASCVADVGAPIRPHPPGLGVYFSDHSGGARKFFGLTALRSHLENTIQPQRPLYATPSRSRPPWVILWANIKESFRAVNPKNPYEGRNRWWYDFIADYMIRNPGALTKDIAAAMGKHPNTISMITNTDLFKTYFAKRKAEWRERHDFAIMSKTADIALLGLDLIHKKMEEKQTQIPLRDLKEVAGDALDRLGFGEKQPPLVQINQSAVDQSQKVFIAVGKDELEEAQQALRLAERVRRDLPLTSDSPALEGPASIEEEIVLDASLTLDN